MLASPVSAAAISYKRAGTATPLAIATDIDVVDRPWMAGSTGCLEDSRKPTSSILPIGNRFEMVRPVAGWDSAQMVEVETRRDRPVGTFIGDTMDDTHRSVIVDFTVSTARSTTLPKPTGFSFEGPCPDAIDETASELLLNRHVAFNIAFNAMANVMGIAQALRMFLPRAIDDLTLLRHEVSVTNGKVGV